MIVLDTAALLWWTLNRSMLSGVAHKAIQESQQINISSISIWEIALKVKQGKLILPVTPRQFLSRLQPIANVRLIAVDESIWLHSVELSWLHRDPADRVIVATADLLNCRLISPDKEIQDFYPTTIW